MHLKLLITVNLMAAETYRAVQTQHDDHEEEDDGEESSSRHVCYGFCVNDKEQAGTWRGRVDDSKQMLPLSALVFLTHRPHLHPLRQRRHPAASSQPCSRAR